MSAYRNSNISVKVYDFSTFFSNYKGNQMKIISIIKIRIENCEKSEDKISLIFSFLYNSGSCYKLDTIMQILDSKNACIYMTTIAARALDV